MRPSNIFLLSSAVSCLLFVLGIVDAVYQREERSDLLHQQSKLVADLGLTDLALFTEARYTRHLSLADLHSAFQDHPMALEHFPSGSLVPPPRRLTE
ncbi:MAG: hypothetical protein B0D96_10450 [Candidatus Sedimenticola endophacoides]|uniref:Uncharacterized protein n=1 Tax=Candidatus Sedimenticola endophacoides TaxID=2548426 RepID=A0A657PX31_9GAMM|nr:MAG: hypothetical protein B0D94_02780 [Candidatus Sedimenticola endophacoides]OQX32484.1 MAG: hypothetical protein B0D84_06135 [Candidatus Sedimenticola endophacoides]OQX33992.1 MAG: hypothetical protein B0D96_10450 [Candidatus Sedimenticola endophacoides]OQX42964.1 MAG: hypothetical protein B0D88_05605 [Candidatus Sedimenticola endophacoides]OQX44906.1 MAG: hypothetical protein B0D86_04685 [Candidatus Sedimenticola endophacoides]